MTTQSNDDEHASQFDGYYDYAPQVTLQRSVTLISHSTHETRVVGHQLAALLGLPATDLDRRVEHRTGQSIAQLVRGDSIAVYRQVEARELIRALDEQPPAIISLGDGVLMDPGNRERVLDASDLVVLDLDLPNTFWRLSAQAPELAEAGTAWHPLYSGPLEAIGQIRPFWQARVAGFAAAPHRLDIAGKHSHQLVGELKDLVHSLVTAPSAN